MQDSYGLSVQVGVELWECVWKRDIGVAMNDALGWKLLDHNDTVGDRDPVTSITYALSLFLSLCLSPRTPLSYPSRRAFLDF